MKKEGRSGKGGRGRRGKVEGRRQERRKGGKSCKILTSEIAGECVVPLLSLSGSWACSMDAVSRCEDGGPVS